ncbi:MAG TPA: beta-ketoacyl synthase chain length factor [Polyangia bacterium]|nr:beta-ketoacyl synthase chain length factor [Polyangia bacterium]
MKSPSADVRGVGFWTGAATGTATGTAAAAAPARAGGSARPRRRGSLLMQMVADVAAQAAAQAGASLARVRLVVGSAFGELGTTVDLLGELSDGGVLSPTRFHNSVHNSAAGALSIAQGNTEAAMSLAAGNDTVAMALLEALAIIDRDGDGDGGPEVLVVVADEPLPAALCRMPAGEAVAAALLLAPPSRSPALARLGGLEPPPAAPPGAFRPVEIDAPCAAIRPLLAAIRAGRPGRVSLSPAGIPGWSIGVEAGSAP